MSSLSTSNATTLSSSSSNESPAKNEDEDEVDDSENDHSHVTKKIAAQSSQLNKINVSLIRLGKILSIFGSLGLEGK